MRTAQQASQTPRPYAPPLVGTEPPPEPAPVYGATYIPGVGFRYLAPGGPRVYGWTYGYRAPVYGYYRARGYRTCLRPRLVGFRSAAGAGAGAGVDGEWH